MVTSGRPDSSGKLVALGTLTGVVTDSSNNVVQSVAANFSAPVSQSSTPATVPASSSTSSASASATTATQPAVTVAAVASCSILNLQLGPIHLDLLGLTLDTNQIVVNLTAVPGAGNLLGSLLCNVSNLLNSGSNVNAIVSLLNQILAAL